MNRRGGKFTGMAVKRECTLLEARRAVGLTQAALADKSGVSQTYISDLEKGSQRNPTIAIVRRLEQALGRRLAFQGEAA